MCNHKKMWVKEMKKYAIVFANTQSRIIRLHKYPVDWKAYLELCFFIFVPGQVDRNF